MKDLIFLFLILFLLLTNAHAASEKIPMIKISDAQYLDTHGKFIANISKQVKDKKGDWVKNIHAGDCIRATFEHPLDNTRDITINARPSNPHSSATIQVYPVYKDHSGNLSEGPLLGSFNNIKHEVLKSVLLKKLQKPTDQFDFRVSGLSGPSEGVDIDWIVDPDVYTLLRSFGIQPTGYGAYGSFVISGSVLYGMTYAGGTTEVDYSGGVGTVFSINTDGTNYTILYNFTGGSDGGDPFGSLLLSGSVLYGMTNRYGSGGDGTIFSVNTDGSGFAVLHSFTGSDGSDPWGDLILSGSVLYGMTTGGGSGGFGTIFSINTNGTGFTLIKSFGSLYSAANPSSLTCSGSVCYVAALGGGSSGDGAIFSINLNGTGFTLLYNFTGGNDGAFPTGALLLSGSVLYGMTSNDGSGGSGTMFSINTDGSGFAVLHSFTGGSDGAEPIGPPVISGSVLYGTAANGGSSGNGDIFSINTDGTGFDAFYSFSGGSDGANPFSSLIISGSVLYGMTYLGGAGYGTIFSINTNGTGFSALYTFTGGSDGGLDLYCSLLLSGSVLYGMTSFGGSSSGYSGDGVIFSINTNGTGFSVLHTFSGGDGKTPVDSLILSGSVLYGTAENGGSSGYGDIFSINTDGTGFNPLYNFSGGSDGGTPSEDSLIISGGVLYGTTNKGGLAYGLSGNGTMFSINTNGTSFNVLYTLLGDSTDGQAPYGSLALSGSVLYGMTSAGGTFNFGDIFSINTNGTGFNPLYNFSGNSDGANPYSSLIVSGSVLYGMNSYGGSVGVAAGGSCGGIDVYGSPNTCPGYGTIFSINTNGTGFSVLYTFTGGSDGGNPDGSLILSGSVLYGMATYRGANVFGSMVGLGTIFSINTNGTGFTVLNNFSGSEQDGAWPVGSLLLSGSVLYGMTSASPTFAQGTIFSVNTNGTSFNPLLQFETDATLDPSNPSGSLIKSGSVLYGTSGGGVGGAIFSIKTDGTSYTVLHTFTGGSDGAGPGSSLILSGSVLYGMAASGGSGGSGTIFSMNTDGSGFAALYSFTGGSDGGSPYGSLLLSGSVLYGMTSDGGSASAPSGYGTIFSINTNGTGFDALYAFTGGSDGANPEGSLVLSGSKLYGMTYDGGSASAPSGYGTIFSINTNGTGFDALYAFTDGSDGANPYGSLLISGSVLYGMAESGGSSGYGSIFSINTNGTGFNSLYSFTDGTDGANPFGSLIFSGSTLYGMTWAGGSAGFGTIFSINPNGSDFSVLHALAGYPSEGGNPSGSFIVSGPVLYGTTSKGGSADNGSVFSFTIPLLSNTFFYGTEI